MNQLINETNTIMFLNKNNPKTKHNMLFLIIEFQISSHLRMLISYVQIRYT